ncbi:hypothetical protein HID58_003923 [Brassica napus]|uniref:RNase H type-1 domain-containing protein n=1 Tax=Brassica napus TaxID=3708 RepID=A0ABQ8EUG7_BRANA|nr:hypothetical protein HID58_003923 [Brassica napus]
MGSAMGGDEKDAFYVVRKGDIVGVYRSFSECQQQASSSVSDPAMSVYKGYGWPQGAQDFISSFGLKNALFSVNATHLKDDSVFGKLIPCPLQQPSSSSSQGDSLDKPSQPKRLLQQMETDESPSSSHPQKHLKTENSSGGMVPRLAVPSSQLTRRPILQNVQDIWKTKHPKMAELCKQAKELMKQFKSFHIQHIDREFNSVADAQANHAINLPGELS